MKTGLGKTKIHYRFDIEKNEGRKKNCTNSRTRSERKKSRLKGPNAWEHLKFERGDGGGRGRGWYAKKIHRERKQLITKVINGGI